MEAPSILRPVRTMPGATSVPTRQELTSLVLSEWLGHEWKSPLSLQGRSCTIPGQGLDWEGQERGQEAPGLAVRYLRTFNSGLR